MLVHYRETSVGPVLTKLMPEPDIEIMASPSATDMFVLARLPDGTEIVEIDFDWSEEEHEDLWEDEE